MMDDQTVTSDGSGKKGRVVLCLNPLNLAESTSENTGKNNESHDGLSRENRGLRQSSRVGENGSERSETDLAGKNYSSAGGGPVDDVVSRPRRDTAAVCEPWVGTLPRTSPMGQSRFRSPTPFHVAPASRAGSWDSKGRWSTSL